MLPTTQIDGERRLWTTLLQLTQTTPLGSVHIERVTLRLRLQLLSDADAKFLAQWGIKPISSMSIQIDD